MKALNLLAFDFGASSGRAVLGIFDGNRIVISAVHQFPNGPVTLTGHMYWDVLRFLGEIKEGLGKAAQTAGGKLASVGIDTWGVDYGLLDASGQLLGSPFHYRDARTAGMDDAAFSRMSKRDIFETTGIAFNPFNTLFQLLAMKLQQPGILAQASTMLFMPDLLSYFLTGVRLTEFTDASTSQLLDGRTRTWSRRLISAMEFPEDIFTDIQQPGSIRGSLLQEICDEVHVPRIPVVTVASHDTASAVAAVPAKGADHAYLSSGTWSLLGVESAVPVTDARALEWNFTNEGGFGGTVRLLRNVMGLWILQECKRHWESQGEEGGFDLLIDLAARSGPFRALIDPDNQMFYNPGDMPARVQEFCRKTGQDVPEERGQIVRCVLESLALKYRWVVDRLEELTNRRVGSLYLVGGGVKNTLLNQFTANAIGRTVVGGPSEATAVGNMLVQAVALGELGDLGDIRRVVRDSFPAMTFEPEDGDRWAEAYERFCNLLTIQPH
jgi:rhamnulokinase